MKYKSKYDIGERAIVMFSTSIEKYLDELSYNCFLEHFPKDFIELLNDNYDCCLKCINYAPKLYFYLNETFQKDKLIKKATIKGYKKFNKNNLLIIKNKKLYLKK